MAENAAAVSLPPVRLDPTQGSSPALNQDPWASFPKAPPPEALSQPITLDEIRAGQRAPAPAEPAPAPTDDPWASFPKADVAASEWESFPKAGELRGYDLTKLKKTSVEDLVKDSAEFNPVEFYAQNTEALLADPAALELVEKAYEQREKQKMTAKEFFLKANPIYAILHPVQTAKTVGKVVKGGGEFLGALGKGVGQVFATGGEVAGNISTGDLPGASKGIAEAAAAFDTAQQHWVTTITSKLLPRPDNIRERLAYDADFKRREIASAAGNGELAKALGTDQEGLKASGVTLDTEAINKLSVIEDPMFLVPIGGAIGVVSRGGKFLLGRAASPAVAESFAKAVNGAMDVAVGGSVKGTGNAAGKALEKVGAAIEKSPEMLGRVGAPLRTGGIVHALATGDISVLATTLAAPVALKYTGKGLGAVGRGIQVAAPVAGKLATEGAKGAAEGAALSIPLFIGSTPEERDALLGMVGGAAMLRAGASGAVAAGDVAARAAQNKLASKIYEPVSRGPVVETPHYGTDPKLDFANAEQTAKLPAGEQSVLNWAREFFRNSGVEIYALDKQTFRNNVPDVAGVDAAEGFFTKRGERIGPDGTRQPVVQVLLNRETNGLGHELYHAFKSLDPQAAQVLESQISKTWTPEEQAWIADTYNSALNGGKPKSQWAVKYDEKQILEEAAAEVFGRVLNATDLSGVRPSIVKRASEFASRTLEKMGYPLAGKALPSGPGVSALGVRPGTSELKTARDFLTDITKRVQDGTLSPPKPGGPLAQGSTEAISTRPKPAQPRTPSEAAPAAPAPQGATPPPLPVTPPESAAAVTAPAAPEPLRPAAPTAENIRVTPAEQGDFAAARSKVTNSEAALKAASPEQAPKVQAINDSITSGHAVEIVHKGVIREGGPSPEAPVARGTRRAEQEAAYIAEAMGEVPDSVREPHQKLFFGTRWIKGGKQLTARSVDKALANIKNAADMAAQTKTTLPYEVEPTTGKLSEAGWSEVVQDLKDYWTNQDRGFRGDGLPLSAETRTRDIGQSIPPQDPAGPAALISPERTDFLNLVQGLNIPRAVTRQAKGTVPGNVKAQMLAEAQGRKPAAPSRIAAEDVQRQTYKPIEGVTGARDIAEVNPLRNDLRAKGAPVENLIEVTENIKAENIESVTPRPDITGRGGSTDITRAGFSVSDVKGEVARRLEDKRKAGVPITEQVRKKTQQEVEFDLRSGKKLGAGEAAGFFSVKGDIVDQVQPRVTEGLYKEMFEKAVRPFFDNVTFDGMMTEIRKVIDGEKVGETFNMDGTVYTPPADRKLDVVPLASENFTPDMANPETLAGFLAKYPEATKNPNVKAGVFKLDDGRISADLNVLVDQSRRAESAEFAKANNQQALFDLAKGEVVPVGGTGEAKVLTAKEVSDAVTRLTGEKKAATTIADVERISKMAPDEWIAATKDFPGGLTPEAYRLGLGLKDRADLNVLADLRAKAEAEARQVMASGDLEAAMGPITKAQFFREAWEAAQGTASAKQGLKRIAEFKEAKPPFAETEGKFSAATAKGKELEGKGWQFAITGEKGNRTVIASKDGVQMGYLATRQRNPDFAEVAMVHLQKDARGQGAGEALYREALTQLQKDNVKLVEGMAVAPEPIKILNKIFEGKFERLEGPEGPVSLEDALAGVDKRQVQQGSFPGVETVNRITPEQKFSVKTKSSEEVATPATGEHVTQKKAAGTPEFNTYVQNKVEKSKEFPEAFPLEFRQDKDGNYRAQWDGEPLPKAKEYNLLKSDLAQKSGSQEKFAEALGEKLEREYHKAKKNPEVAEGEHWYSTFRDKVGRVLGDDSKLFAELLGATSPQQAVGPNFKDALGAYNQFKSGAYDAMLAKYREGKEKFADGDLAEFTAETGKTGKKATYEAFMGWWQLKHDLIPKKATGKKFGMNSKSVLKVLDRSWLAGVQGPKTPNFTGNLSGTTFKATIDVWAMRLLSRLAGEDSGKPWRIQPANESGVKDKEFFFGQDAFQRAADKLGIKADALQAILWFAEKDLWEKNGWTGAAGKAKSDYNTLLERTTKSPEGKLVFVEADVKPKSKSKKSVQLELKDVDAKKY